MLLPLGVGMPPEAARDRVITTAIRKRSSNLAYVC